MSKFQKNLVVWKHFPMVFYTIFIEVSEELSSVETEVIRRNEKGFCFWVSEELSSVETVNKLGVGY